MFFIITYLILLVSAAFLNSVVWSLVAIPVFVVGLLLLCRHLLGMSSTRVNYGILSALLVVAGAIGLGIVIFQASIFASTMLSYPEQVARRLYPDIGKTLVVLVIGDLAASWAITTGVKTRSGLGGDHLLKIFALALATPVWVAVLVKLLKLLGVPFTA